MIAEGFFVHFSKLEDPRIVNHNSRHKFFDIIYPINLKMHSLDFGSCH